MSEEDFVPVYHFARKGQVSSCGTKNPGFWDSNPAFVTCGSCLRTTTFKRALERAMTKTESVGRPTEPAPAMHYLRNASATACGLNVLGDRATKLERRRPGTWDPDQWAWNTTIIRDSVTCEACNEALGQQVGGAPAESVGRPTEPAPTTRLDVQPKGEPMTTHAFADPGNPGTAAVARCGADLTGRLAYTGTDPDMVTCSTCKHALIGLPDNIPGDTTTDPEWGDDVEPALVHFAPASHEGQPDCGMKGTTANRYLDVTCPECLNRSGMNLTDDEPADGIEPDDDGGVSYAVTVEVRRDDRGKILCTYTLGLEDLPDRILTTLIEQAVIVAEVRGLRN